jgi:hypothetical protein
VYAAAVLLHPSLRRAYFDSIWAHQQSYIEPAINGARQLWRECFRPEKPADVDNAQLDSITDPLQRWRAKQTGALAIDDEFEDFIKVVL